MIELNRILNQFDINFPPEEIEYFKSKISTKSIKKHDYFFIPNNTCNELGFVIKGLLRSFIIVDGKEYNIEFYFEDQFVSTFTSFLTHLPSDWTIQAVEKSELMIVTQELLSTLYQRNNCWVMFGKNIFERQTIKKCRREKSLIGENAATRYKMFREEYHEIENRISLYHIASYLGITPETLSRLRKK